MITLFQLLNIHKGKRNIPTKWQYTQTTTMLNVNNNLRLFNPILSMLFEPERFSYTL